MRAAKFCFATVFHCIGRRSFVMGPPHERVAVIILDTRCLRSRAPHFTPLVTTNCSYFLTEPDADGATVLGSEQWQWLRRLPALDARQHVALTIVASSIQLVNNQSYDSEHWGLFPAERARMLALLRSWPCAVVVISGDRHYSEVAQDCRSLFLSRSIRSHVSHVCPQREQGRVGSNHERHRPIARSAAAAIRLQPVQVCWAGGVSVLLRDVGRGASVSCYVNISLAVSKLRGIRSPLCARFSYTAESHLS